MADSRAIRNIKSIQVFHAVCETRNVTKAALALNTSQSSVSYHIKKLETDLSIALFRRTRSGLELTEAGSLLATYVERGLTIIQAGQEHVTGKARSVRMALLPMFASRWLSPRLGQLLESRPGLHLSIQNHNNTYATMADPDRFADLGIQWGQGHWPAFEVTPLWPERLVVVCSAGYLRQHPISSPRDLARCTLLHVDDTQMWDDWFHRNGLTLAPSQQQMMLEDRHFQLSSTINGLGVSLFAWWLVRKEMESGELVDPFAHRFETSFAYHLVCPRERDLSPSARWVRDWLLETSAGGPAAEAR